MKHDHIKLNSAVKQCQILTVVVSYIKEKENPRKRVVALVGV